jgi:hypothetical protein
MWVRNGSGNVFADLGYPRPAEVLTEQVGVKVAADYRSIIAFVDDDENDFESAGSGCLR